MKPTILKRVWAEIEEANAGFFNLRTHITPDLIDDDVTKFYFTMMPNDGAMAHLNLVGRFFIPEDYPTSPPIVQLYTPTQRYNVDVYKGFLSCEKPSSTMCFDILRSEAQGGTWKPDYTLSCLFASLLSAIVSFYVMQQGGYEREEPVSMDHLHSVKENTNMIWRREQSHFPNPIPRIPLVEATTVPAKPLFSPQKIAIGSKTVMTSEPIFLQTGSDEVYSFAVDLTALHANIVFSVVLSNSTDLIGKKKRTILFRNGVTATAARKLANEPIKWFYHGKPMNDGDMRLHVSVGRNQMTFAYYENGRLYVHGDTPVSKLDKATIGNVRDMPFYVHIFTNDKSLGSVPLKGRPEPGSCVIEVLDIEGKGYIHQAKRGEESNDFGFEIVEREEADIEEDEESGGVSLIEPAAADEGLVTKMAGVAL
ncbi:hypothetical protein DE146DRAFT_669459 [Phaeosphaeria sp. MPI-PUGE-AT-0046c]|nr:hypothetical protein DE146DRAFT_669459 [Phaeosphaeria sp. MPI-PUGE-AT-0046c]